MFKLLYDSNCLCTAQMLLYIRGLVEVLSSTILGGFNFKCPPPLFIMSIPACLHHSPWDFRGRKSCRQSGKWGGISVKLKLCLARLPAHYPCMDYSVFGLDRGHSILPRSLEFIHQCVQPVILNVSHNSLQQWLSFHLRWRRVNHGNLHPLSRVA